MYYIVYTRIEFKFCRIRNAFILGIGFYQVLFGFYDYYPCMTETCQIYLDCFNKLLVKPLTSHCKVYISIT